jgi:hypothetical protein
MTALCSALSPFCGKAQHYQLLMLPTGRGKAAAFIFQGNSAALGAHLP